MFIKNDDWSIARRVFLLFFLYRHEICNFRFRCIFSALPREPYSTIFSAICNTFIERYPLLVLDKRFSLFFREIQYPQYASFSNLLAKAYDNYQISNDMKTKKCYGFVKEIKSRHYCRRRYELRYENRIRGGEVSWLSTRFPNVLRDALVDGPDLPFSLVVLVFEHSLCRQK